MTAFLINRVFKEQVISIFIFIKINIVSVIYCDDDIVELMIDIINLTGEYIEKHEEHKMTDEELEKKYNV